MFNTVDTASECSNATMALIALCRSSSSTASSSLSRFHDGFTVFLSSQTNLQNIYEFVDVWTILKEQNIFCQLHPFRIAFAWPQYMDWPFFPDISPISNNLFRYSFTLTGNLVFFLCFLRAYPTFSTNWSSSIFTVSAVRFGWLWRNDEIFHPTFVLFCQQLYLLLPCHKMLTNC